MADPRPATQDPRLIQGVTAATYFGPLQPIDPAVRPDMAEAAGVLGRQYDYPVGYNTRIIPRQEELVGFDTLRNLADSLDVLRLVIETRKDQLSKLEWRFVAKEGQKATDKEIGELTDFWTSPDRQNNWDEWLRALMEDSYVIDAATVYPRPTKKGERLRTAKGYTYCFELLDGATVKPLIDGRGRQPKPPSVAYQQIIKGMPSVEYTIDELIYRPRNVRTHKVYGFPEVEQIVMTVNIALRRELHKLQFYTEGNIPEALIGVPKEWSVEQIAAYQLYWDSVLAGNTAERRHAKFVPDGAKYIPTKEGALKGDFDEWLIRVICYALSVSPAPFVKIMNRATAQSQQTAAIEEGLVPRMRWIANLVNYLTWYYLQKPNVQFTWQEEESTDPLQQAEIWAVYIDKGIQTPKQAAEQLGLDWIEPPPDKPEPGHITEAVDAQGAEAGSGKQEAKSTVAQPSTAASSSDKKTEVLPEGQKEPATAKQITAKPVAKNTVIPAQAGIQHGSSASSTQSILDGLGGDEGPTLADVRQSLLKGDVKGAIRLMDAAENHLRKSAAKKYRELPQIQRDNPDALKAQKAIANRLRTLFTKQRKAFPAQASALLRGFASSREIKKADVPPEVQAIIDQIELEGFAVIPAELQPYLQQIFAATGAKVLENLNIASAGSAAAVDDAALAYAQTRSAEMVGKKWVDGELIDNPNAAWSIEETTREQLNSIITNAFSGEEQTAGWRDIASQIEALTNDSDVFSASRAEMIARTEIGTAQMEGAKAGYDEGKALGLSYQKKWIADPEAEDECSANADEDWIDYDDIFSSGDDMPLAHPRCRCDMAVRVVDESEEGGAEDAGEWPYK